MAVIMWALYGTDDLGPLTGRDSQCAEVRLPDHQTLLTWTTITVFLLIGCRLAVWFLMYRMTVPVWSHKQHLFLPNDGEMKDKQEKWPGYESYPWFGGDPHSSTLFAPLFFVADVRFNIADEDQEEAQAQYFDNANSKLVIGAERPSACGLCGLQMLENTKKWRARLKTRFVSRFFYNLTGAVCYVWLPLAGGIYYWDQRAKVISLNERLCPDSSSATHKDVLSNFADNVTWLFYVGGIFALLDVLVVTANAALATHAPRLSRKNEN